MLYLLAKLEVAYGKMDEFNEIMSYVVPAMEERGCKLIGAYTNRIGRLMRVYDLYEMEDANTAFNAVSELMTAETSREVADALGKIIISEESELMETLPYHPG